MIDKSFEEFVRQNLMPLDELARRYAEYRIEVSQSYLNELRANIRARTPADYSFVEDKCRVLVAGEQVCGWSRDLEVSGTKTAATICFGFNITVSSSLSGDWPFMNGGCWTGIRAWLPAGQRREAILASVRQLALDSERIDRNWILWLPWEPLSATTVEGFHERITAKDRAAGQNEIVERLFQWKTNFEKSPSAGPHMMTILLYKQSWGRQTCGDGKERLHNIRERLYGLVNAAQSLSKYPFRALGVF